MQKYRIVYNVPFSPDPEIRETVFDEEFIASDSTAARKEVYKKHPNATIQRLDPVRF